MRKEFSISNEKIIINFTAKYCNTFEAVLESEGFRRVLDVYLKKAQGKKLRTFKYLEKTIGTNDIGKIRDIISKVFRCLTVMDASDITNPRYTSVVEDRNEFIVVVEDLYSFWRKLERYTLVHAGTLESGLAAMSFTEANSNFSALILNLYRKVEKNIIGAVPKVYRQIPAGGNASIMITGLVWPIPEGYEVLEDIPFIDSIMLETPFITYPKKNTRDGLFTEVDYNPLKYTNINKDHWFCYPAKVGESLAYIYFHRDYMEHGITLCNLFEMARKEECRGRKPDMIFVFGASDDGDELKTVFYDDKKNDIMLGYINHSEKIDYFGYMKKMALTLHNLIMIKKGFLPIHGAMVNIIMKNGKTANVVIMGDSGAGKSESIEAFRALSEDYVSEMLIIFDDMGTFKLEDDKIVGYGTEIGAFVRLDDLDQGYAFKEIDRSIFMNPDKINARLVMPTTPYKEVVKGYPVDYFFYANNYTAVNEGQNSLDYFKTPKEAMSVFVSGARMAKGTTTEKGLVETFFANPFGPVQKKEDTEVLIEKYFDAMFNKCNVKVGQIKTCLGVSGQEKEGPKNAAIELFEEIKKI